MNIDELMKELETLLYHKKNCNPTLLGTIAVLFYRVFLKPFFSVP